MLREQHRRSIIKSIGWRGMGILVLAIITWLVTRSLIQTSIITFLHHFTFIWVYYLHERLWVLIGKKVEGVKRTIARTLLYEIVLGNLILGTITYLITGSWLSVSLITPIYIGNKLWLYGLYDKLWSKVKWGKK